MNCSLNAQKQPLYFWQTIPQMKGLLNIKKNVPGNPDHRRGKQQRNMLTLSNIFLREVPISATLQQKKQPTTTPKAADQGQREHIEKMETSNDTKPPTPEHPERTES